MTMPDGGPPILREDEFALSLAEASQDFGSVLCLYVDDEARSTGGHLASRLVEEAHALETFLDDHGARQNHAFVLTGELVASLRGLARVRLNHHHLLHRIPRYELLLSADPLRQDLASSEGLLDAAIVELGRCLVDEVSRHGISWAPAHQASEMVSGRQRQLPRDLDADVTADESSHLATLATRFLAVVKASSQLDLQRRREAEELPGFVAHHASEDRCRWYESAVHNIQSMYDTYVHGTATETAHPWLRQLRGHASVALHLLEMATDLVHFYERHENDIRHEPAREAIATRVSKGVILEMAVNTCLHHAASFVQSASGLADRVLSTFLTQREQVLRLPEGLTLHARPLALIVQVAKHHRSPIEVSIEGRACSANSLMSLIMLAGQFPGARDLTFRGDVAALNDLRVLFGSGLGEGGAPLPAELPYLHAGPSPS